MIISIWQTFDDWINWKESDEKESAEAKLEKFLQVSRVTIYETGVPRFMRFFE